VKPRGARPSRADQYPPLRAGASDLWVRYGQWEELYFPRLIGLQVEEVRDGYCRMRLPWRLEITHPAGVAHGGALASLIDSVVVPAIGSHYAERRAFATIDLHVQYLSALVGEDAVAEGWVTQRGRSIVFCEAEIVGATSQRTVARGALAYKVSSRILEEEAG
jgi:uncharacterized protein (TIGR00369 family)